MPADHTEARRFLKSRFAQETSFVSDQTRRIPMPPLEKPFPSDAQLLELPAPDMDLAVVPKLHACLRQRQSRRHFKPEPLSLPQLAYLLWATQGVRETGPRYSLRTVPSAGARHPFETYLALLRVTGVPPGVYRYLPLEHKLLSLFAEPQAPAKLMAAAVGQDSVAAAAAVFFWACLPYRTEWRYGPHAHKVMLLDAGHICQNLYLACESLGLGTCAIGAYSQELVDAFLRLDGREEFVVYFAPVGKV